MRAMRSESRAMFSLQPLQPERPVRAYSTLYGRSSMFVEINVPFLQSQVNQVGGCCEIARYLVIRVVFCLIVAKIMVRIRTHTQTLANARILRWIVRRFSSMCQALLLSMQCQFARESLSNQMSLEHAFEKLIISIDTFPFVFKLAHISYVST